MIDFTYWVFDGMAFYEYDRGHFDSALTHNGKEVAHTEGEKIIAYDKAYEKAIIEWAEMYEYPIEWKE